MDIRTSLSIIAQEAASTQRLNCLSSLETFNNDEFELDGLDSPAIESPIQKQLNRLNPLDFIPDNVCVNIFSYLTPLDLVHSMRVCRRWYRLISTHSHLWRRLYLRPESSNGPIGAVHIRRVDIFLHVLATRFGSALIYIDLPIELITIEVLRELAIRCPNLEYLTLDFSTAMQLHDFSELNEFPCNLKCLCICLSDVIFLEGFMRRIYTFLSSLHILHIIGTLEKSSLFSTSAPEETDDYETINLSKIKAHAPNLRIINLYGISFLDDNHIEAIASGCIHLECLALNYCIRVEGKSLKTLLNRCRKLTCLLLQNTGLTDEAIRAVDWKNSQLCELDISSTDLSEETLIEFLTNLPKLSYLAVSFCDGFTDKVLESLLEHGKLNNCRALDLSNTVNLTVEAVHHFLTTFAGITYKLEAFSYTGEASITEQFWTHVIRHMHRIKVLIMGTPHSWFNQVARRIHIDQILDACSNYCPYLQRLEIQWDPETLRFSENSSKFIDYLRLRCTRLMSFVLSDGTYYESAKANFERADRIGIVRTRTMYQTSIVSALKYYHELKFN